MASIAHSLGLAFRSKGFKDAAGLRLKEPYIGNIQESRGVSLLVSRVPVQCGHNMGGVR